MQNKLDTKRQNRNMKSGNKEGVCDIQEVTKHCSNSAMVLILKFSGERNTSEHILF